MGDGVVGGSNSERRWTILGDSGNDNNFHDATTPPPNVAIIIVGVDTTATATSDNVIVIIVANRHRTNAHFHHPHTTNNTIHTRPVPTKRHHAALIAVEACAVATGTSALAAMAETTRAGQAKLPGIHIEIGVATDAVTATANTPPITRSIRNSSRTINTNDRATERVTTTTNIPAIPVTIVTPPIGQRLLPHETTALAPPHQLAAAGNKVVTQWASDTNMVPETAAAEVEAAVEALVVAGCMTTTTPCRLHQHPHLLVVKNRATLEQQRHPPP